MPKSLKFLPLLSICILLASCHGKKHSTREPMTPGVYYSMPEVYGALSAGYEEWTDAYMPLTVSLTAPVDFSISGRATMVRDSLIHISLRVLGIEAGVIRIGADSILVIDKYDKIYMAESTDMFLGAHTLTIRELQDVLLGQAYPQGSPKVKACISDGEPPVLQAIEFISHDSLTINVNYFDYYDTPAGIVASNTVFSGRVPSNSIVAGLKWNIGRAEWNTGRRPAPIHPGKGYKRIDLNAIIENLAKSSL